MKNLRQKYRNIILRDFRTLKNGRVVNYNIGTAAHAPGNIAVLKKYLAPDTKISIWAEAPLSPPLDAMMRRGFPEVPIIAGTLKNGVFSSPELESLVRESDLFLISSGSGMPLKQSMLEYHSLTGRPCGAWAVGFSPQDVPELRIMDFAFYRDSISADEAVKTMKECPPLLGGAPDAVFRFDCADEEGASAFMAEKGLEPGNFICCIPGARYTPRWEFFDTPVRPERLKRNQEREEPDNGPLRGILTEAVRRFGVKALICAEQIPEMRIARETIYEKLPEDVRRASVLLNSFWAPDLALAVYRKSLCVFGIEMHSQVMAVGSGVPAAVFRHSGFGSKSEMWKDIGLGDWLLDIDEPDYARRGLEVVSGILSSYGKALETVRAAVTQISRAERTAAEAAFFQAEMGQ